MVISDGQIMKQQDTTVLGGRMKYKWNEHDEANQCIKLVVVLLYRIHQHQVEQEKLGLQDGHRGDTQDTIG